MTIVIPAVYKTDDKKAYLQSDDLSIYFTLNKKLPSFLGVNSNVSVNDEFHCELDRNNNIKSLKTNNKKLSFKEMFAVFSIQIFVSAVYYVIAFGLFGNSDVISNEILIFKHIAIFAFIQGVLVHLLKNRNVLVHQGQIKDLNVRLKT